MPMPKTCTGRGAGGPRSVSAKAVPVAPRAAPTAQSRNSTQRPNTACGSAAKRPRDTVSTSTPPSATSSVRRPFRFAIRIVSPLRVSALRLASDPLDDELPQAALVDLLRRRCARQRGEEADVARLLVAGEMLPEV